MNENEPICPICKKPAVVYRDITFMLSVRCGRCGDFSVRDILVEDWQRWREQDNQDELARLPYLAAATRQSRERLTITNSNWRQLAERFQHVPVPEKLQKLLSAIAEKATTPNQWMEFYPDNFAPLIAARDESEVNYLLGHLSATGLVAYGSLPDKQYPSGYPVFAIQLTVSGWEAVAPFSTGVPGTCFVAMAYDPALDEAYDAGFVPAIQSCGFTVLRVDKTEHNDEITDRIIAGIRAAEFVVADFTLHRGGVYYEAGFARGLGKEVVMTCRKDDVERLHFDTRQRSHVVWDSVDDLREKLELRIKATITRRADHG